MISKSLHHKALNHTTTVGQAEIALNWLDTRHIRQT